MSKWGLEEQETINAINKAGLFGNILNVAAGDGRFNNKLLEISNTVTAIDISANELEQLKINCPKNLENKLYTKIVDITKGFPFSNNIFDGIFCTGTLHLFDMKTIKYIIDEMKRVLKINGKIILDFATDIIRLDKYGNKIIFDMEGNYSIEQAITFFKRELTGFDINIDIATFSEENLEENAGYQSIEGKFLVVSGTKIRFKEL